MALHLRRSDEAALARATARCEQAGIGTVWNSALAACRALGVVPPGADLMASWRGKAVARMLPEMWRSGRWPPFGRKVALRVALKPSLRFAAHELARLVVVPEDWQRESAGPVVLPLLLPAPLAARHGRPAGRQAQAAAWEDLTAGPSMSNEKVTLA